MKSLLLLLCSACILAFSNNTQNNFKISNGQVIWQKVYNSHLTQKQIVEIAKTSGYFENVDIVNKSTITAGVREISPDYKRCGESFLSAPSLVSLYHIKAYAVIEFKEKQFRVTLKSIELVEKQTDRVGRQITDDIEHAILNKDNSAFKASFLRKSSKILDFTFQTITNFGKIQEDSDW